MAVARARQRDTSTPGGSSGLPLVVKVAARYDAAGGARAKLPAGVSRTIGAPTRASYLLRAKRGIRSTHIASRRPTPPAVPPANWTKRCWPGTGSPARMFPKPTTYACARPRMTCAPTVSTSTRRAASESRSLRIVSLVTTYPTRLNSTMSKGSPSPNEPAERSRECFKGSVHRAAPPEPWQAFNRMRRGRAGRRGTARRTRSPGGFERGLLTDEAVSPGIRATVTSAAAVMIGVFSIVATLSSLDFKEMGVGLASAVLIDATIVRAVLVPARTKPLAAGIFFGYLPSWLEWLPQVAPEPRRASRARALPLGFLRDRRARGRPPDGAARRPPARRGQERAHADPPRPARRRARRDARDLS